MNDHSQFFYYWADASLRADASLQFERILSLVCKENMLIFQYLYMVKLLIVNCRSVVQSYFSLQWVFSLRSCALFWPFACFFLKKHFFCHWDLNLGRLQCKLVKLIGQSAPPHLFRMWWIDDQFVHKWRRRWCPMKTALNIKLKTINLTNWASFIS